MNIRTRLMNLKALVSNDRGAVSQEYALTTVTATAIVGVILKFIATGLGTSLFTSVVSLIIQLIPTFIEKIA